MTLYEINAQLEELLENSVDPETGEISEDFEEQLDKLLLDRENKLENICLAYKNCLSDAEALKAEKLAFEKRQKIANNKAERLKNYIQYVLAGEKFKTTKVAVSYRKTESTEIDPDVFFSCADNARYFRIKEEADKKAIADAIKAGETIEGAELISKQSMTIK